MNIINYNGASISFNFTDTTKMINATQMAKAFGKRPNDWLKLPNTKRYLNALQSSVYSGKEPPHSDGRKSPTGTQGFDSQLIVTRKGDINSGYGGTWFHYKLALRFAQWLSPEFSIWVDVKIEELLTTGKTEIQPKSEETLLAEAVLIAQRTIARQKQELIAARPKVIYHDKVLNSKSTLTTKEIAMEFGMSAQTLNQILRSKGIQYKQGKRWYIRAKYAGKGYASNRTKPDVMPDGSVISRTYMVWTQSGRKFIHDLFD